MVILIKITDIFRTPQMSIIIDPWEFLDQGRLKIEGNFFVLVSKPLEVDTQSQNTSPVVTVGEEGRGSLYPREQHPASTRGRAGRLVNMQAQPDTFRRTWYRGNPIPSPAYGSSSGYPGFSGNPYDNSAWAASARNSSDSSIRATIFPPELVSVETSHSVPPIQAQNGTLPLWPTVSIQTVSRETIYQYGKLESGLVRIFTLFPGEQDDPLHGSIWMTSLGTNVCYATVSYVWGQQSIPSSGIHTPVGTLKITESLDVTLRKLRKRHRTLDLWVDAICINQNDNHEKAEQVKILGLIFQNSTQTLGCIRAKEESDEVIEMLMQVRAREILGENLADWPTNLAVCPKSWGNKSLPPPDDPIWPKVANFFRNDWFRRVWIIQEVVIARRLRLVCGRYAKGCHWDDLYHAIQMIDDDPETRMQCGETRQTWQPFLRLGRVREYELRSSRLSMMVLLENFRHCQSTKRRDRFFSLLGIAADGHLEDFELDYASSFETVAKRFANTLFQKYSAHNKGMLFLYHASLNHREPALPSWMPDWTREQQGSLHSSAARGTEFRAAWGTDESFTLSPDTSELTTEAYFVDEIETTTQASIDTGPEGLSRFFLEVEEMLSQTHGSLTEAERGEILWQVPIAGATRPKAAVSGDQSLFSSWEAFWRLVKSDWTRKGKKAVSKPAIDQEAIGGNSSLSARSRVYASLLTDEVRGWRFVTTKRRKLCGMAPPAVRQHDAVYIISGGDVPFITRPSNARPHAHRLVGQAYVHGIMQGEALDFDDIDVERSERLTLH